MAKKQQRKPEQKPLDVGRPPKYNDPQILKVLFDTLHEGASIQAACDLAGIDKSNITKWCRYARSGDEKYIPFLNGYKKARAGLESALVKNIRTAANTQWQAAAWMLERLKPKRYGRKNNISFNGDAIVRSGAINPEQFVQMLTAEQLSQLISAIENKTKALEESKEQTDANI